MQEGSDKPEGSTQYLHTFSKGLQLHYLRKMQDQRSSFIRESVPGHRQFARAGRLSSQGDHRPQSYGA